MTDGDIGGASLATIGDLERETGLAGATGPDERHESTRRDVAVELVDEGLSGDELGERERREVAGLDGRRGLRRMRLVVTDGSRDGRRELAVVSKNRPFHRDQLGPGVETQLVDQQSAALLERPQSVGLATLSVEPVHQHRP